MDRGNPEGYKLKLRTGVKPMNQPDEKKTGRFIILLSMALIIFAITVWAFLQSLSYIKGTNNTLDNQTVNNDSVNIADEKKQIDIDKLGKDILAKVKFETELKQIDETVARELLEVSDSSNLQLYMGNGNYSDELILIASSSEKEAVLDQKIVEKYLSDMKKSFDTYIPEQSKKISDAVIIQSGCYTVICVTSDTDSAKEIIQTAFEQDSTESKPSESPVEVTIKPSAKHTSYKKIYSNDTVTAYPSGVITIGNTAYEQYDYIEDIAVKYTDTVNNIAAKLKEKADVYSLIIPTSIGVTLPDNKKTEAGSSDQEIALEKIISKMSHDIKVVPLYDGLMSHRKEYIYFRTDHHWTAKGAYYAYREFCKIRQITPNQIADYKRVSFGSFTGSFYKETGQKAPLEKDEFYVYYPINNANLTLKYTNKDGVTINGNVIEDASGYGESLKYSAFIDGDNPFTIIENNTLNNGSSCVVIKESFGNSFIPYLADHYQTVYAIDYRYWSGKLTTFIDENPVDDVIILNNISMTRNSYQVGKMALLVEESDGI